MIPQRYVKRFLERPLRDYRRLKGMTERQLESAVKRLPMCPHKWDKLTRDQKICVLILALRPRFAVWSDPSAGKTLIAMVAAEYHERRGKLCRVLVLVPRRANKDEWAFQVEEHYPQLGCMILRGSSEDKWRQLSESDDCLLVVETYAGFTRLVCETVRGRLKPDWNLVDKIIARFDGVIGDESSTLGGGASVTKQSLIFQLLNRLSWHAYLFILMSGTPFGRDPSLIWAQMYLVDHGETLGKSLGLFQAAFFGERDYWGKRQFLKTKRRDLHRLLAHNSIRFKVSETELPKRRPIKRYISIPIEQQEWLGRFYDVLEHDPDKRKKESAFLRIRQLSSGFVGFTDDENGERAQITFAENPKLEALCDYALSIPVDYQFLVFHEWIWSGEQIAREFSRIGISHTVLRGKTRDPEKVLRSFKNGDKQALIVNVKSGDYGLNLQTGRYAIYYESPVSAITRKQTERRIIRRYSKNRWAAIVDLIMKGTMDERVLKFHEEGADLLAAILDGTERVR
jgi:superfamily II DNA or RNA helicase